MSTNSPSDDRSAPLRKITVILIVWGIRYSKHKENMTKLIKHSIESKIEKRRLFKIWKQENQQDDLTIENAVDFHKWYYVLDSDRKLVGFYIVQPMMDTISLIYVLPKYRHRGLSAQICSMSGTSGIQLGLYDTELLTKIKKAYETCGFTNHRVASTRKGSYGMVIGEFLFNPTKNIDTLGLVTFMDADSNNLVRI